MVGLQCKQMVFKSYGSGSTGFETGFDIQKIFHQNKPNRSSDNTKNPTISSNSWGRRFSTGTLGLVDIIIIDLLQLTELQVGFNIPVGIWMAILMVQEELLQDL